MSKVVFGMCDRPTLYVTIFFVSNPSFVVGNVPYNMGEVRVTLYASVTRHLILYIFTIPGATYRGLQVSGNSGRVQIGVRP